LTNGLSAKRIHEKEFRSLRVEKRNRLLAAPAGGFQATETSMNAVQNGIKLGSSVQFRIFGFHQKKEKPGRARCCSDDSPFPLLRFLRAGFG